VKKLACFQQLQGLKDSIPSLVHPKDSIAQGFKGYSSPFSLSQRNLKNLVTSLEMQVA
jgi:hypothetical protein